MLTSVDDIKINVSDYGYAAAPSNWITALFDYDDVTSTNWLYLGSNEWTISRRAEDGLTVFSVINRGVVFSDHMRMKNAIRPSFYLESSVSIADGTGTSSDPYRLSF